MNDVQPIPNAPARSLAALWFEILVVASVAVMPDVVRSIQLLTVERPPTLGFTAFALRNILRSTPAILVTLFVISRSDRPWRDFGIRRVRIVFDALVAVLLAALAYGAYYALWMVLSRSGDWFASLVARGAANAYRFIPPHNAEWALLPVMALINGFAEEVVMHGYLITQLERATRSSAAALLISTILFAAYHTYQGIPGVVGGITISLVFGGGFMITRRLWPVALGHAILDVVGFALRA